MKKRHLFNIALCALLASSCSRADVTVTDDHTICFGGLEVSRKVIGDKSSFTEGDAIAVFGAEYQNDISQQYQLFDNTRVTLWGTSWTYDAKAYWMEGTSYRFQAFYPYPDVLSPQSEQYLLTSTMGASNHYSIGHFTVNRMQENQLDLLVSDVVSRGPIDYNNPEGMKPVSFSFSHLLTNIHLTVKTLNSQNGIAFRLTNVRLVGMKSTGNCNDGVWDTSSAEIDAVGFRRHFLGEEGTVDDTGFEIWPGGLLLIPQSVTPDMKLEIDFMVTRTISTPGQPDQQITSKDSRTIPLTADPLWENASKIDYVATIDSNSNIGLMVVSVEPWEVVENSHNIIVR